MEKLGIRRGNRSRFIVSYIPDCSVFISLPPVDMLYYHYVYFLSQRSYINLTVPMHTRLQIFPHPEYMPFCHLSCACVTYRLINSTIYKVRTHSGFYSLCYLLSVRWKPTSTFVCLDDTWLSPFFVGCKRVSTTFSYLSCYVLMLLNHVLWFYSSTSRPTAWPIEDCPWCSPTYAQWNDSETWFSECRQPYPFFVFPTF